MNKLVSLKANGELSISVESKLFKSVRKMNAWFADQKATIPMLIFLIAIDILGFNQIAEATMTDNKINRMLIIAAFAVAFEIAPLYIGYAICLKSYRLGKQIHDIILWLSSVSFVLGIIGNGIYRFLTMNIAYRTLDTDGITFVTAEVALPMTILMFILPIITSLINIVIGCLSFDPLLYDLLKLSKKLRVLHIRKRQIIPYIEEISKDDDFREKVLSSEEQCFENAKAELVTVSMRLKNYISAQSTTEYKDS